MLYKIFTPSQQKIPCHSHIFQTNRRVFLFNIIAPIHNCTKSFTNSIIVKIIHKLLLIIMIIFPISIKPQKKEKTFLNLNLTVKAFHRFSLYIPLEKLLTKGWTSYFYQQWIYLNEWWWNIKSNTKLIATHKKINKWKDFYKHLYTHFNHDWNFSEKDQEKYCIFLISIHTMMYCDFKSNFKSFVVIVNVCPRREIIFFRREFIFTSFNNFSIMLLLWCSIESRQQ